MFALRRCFVSAKGVPKVSFSAAASNSVHVNGNYVESDSASKINSSVHVHGMFQADYNPNAAKQQGNTKEKSHDHHSHDGPHLPPPLVQNQAKVMLLFMWLWVMYRAKENKGAFLGFYKPWLEPAHHEEDDWQTIGHLYGLDTEDDFENDHGHGHH